MQAQSTQPVQTTHQPLSELTKLTIAALIVIVVAFMYLQAVLLKRIEMPVPILQVLTLVLAGALARGWRWTPLLAPLWVTIMISGNWGPISYDLTHPENTHAFGLTSIMVATMVVCGGLGVAAAIQNFRNPHALRAPAAVRPLLLAMVGLLVGAVGVAAIPRQAGTTATPQMLAALPGVSLSAFDGGTIKIKASTLAGLRLENTSSVGHSFDVDELGVHTGLPANQNSLALLPATKPGTYLFYCAPHYNKATGQGMHGTLIIEP